MEIEGLHKLNKSLFNRFNVTKLTEQINPLALALMDNVSERADELTRANTSIKEVNLVDGPYGKEDQKKKNVGEGTHTQEHTQSSKHRISD